jgi:hypothetical protein
VGIIKKGHQTKKKFQFCVIWAVFFQFCVMRPIAKKARKSGLNLERYPRIKIQRTTGAPIQIYLQQH